MYTLIIGIAIYGFVLTNSSTHSPFKVFVITDVQIENNTWMCEGHQDISRVSKANE